MNDRSPEAVIAPMNFGSWLSVSLYAIACALPAIAFTDNPIPGIFCLIAIPLVCVVPWWYANPAFFLGFVMLRRGKVFAAAIWGTAAAIVGASYAVMALGNTDMWHELRIGSWVWLLSLWTFAANACWAAWTRTHSDHPG